MEMSVWPQWPLVEICCVGKIWSIEEFSLIFCKTLNFFTYLASGTLSNAFEKSRIPMSTCFLLFNAQAKSSVVNRSWDPQERLALIPYWLLHNILFVSRCFIIWLTEMCSKVLQTNDVKDTGQQLDGSYLLPFSNIGVMKADFHSCGIFPVVKDCF